jgi:preprotein translocase subunit Sec61beta
MVWVFIQISQEEILAIGAFIAIVVILYYILNHFETRRKKVF